MERTPEVERLTEHGCSVLCLGCPEGMLFGIDYSAWAVGPRFMGVKLVPPGLHYVYCSASAEDVGVARTGFFLHMRPGDVSVFRWDPEVEELAPLENLDEEARYADGVRCFDFDAHLGPYPLQLASQWAELTRHATAGLVGKIEPVSRAVRSKRAEYDARGPNDPAEAQQAAQEAQEGLEGPEEGQEGDDAEMDVEPQQQQQAAGPKARRRAQPQGQAPPAAEPQLESNSASGNLFFSVVPRARKGRGGTPAETTRLHMDRSEQLEEMITREYGGEELGILGELQLAYVAFLLGQNFDGFEQWRALLQLLCGCEAAAARRPELFAELCRTFFAQLSQAPSDLFGDDLTRDNFMGACALSLLEVCDTEAAPAKLRKRCGKVRELVEQKFGLTTEDLALLGEDAPLVVEADGRDLVDLTGPALVGMD
mmetsp:Transcript_65594/g.211612  ORF Transcript_65594/g.211612 Transcript_65594/m.211612 type:complete len:425 (-) Transcript_65594:62-1336(-)